MVFLRELILSKFPRRYTHFLMTNSFISSQIISPSTTDLVKHKSLYRHKDCLCDRLMFCTKLFHPIITLLCIPTTQVSAIIDVDILPDTCRRVKLLKHGHDKPLGFYIKDGDSYRVGNAGGIEKVPGVFISRLVPGGLAEGTGLLAVNDEVLEVNGIVVDGKTLDQVCLFVHL